MQIFLQYFVQIDKKKTFLDLLLSKTFEKITHISKKSSTFAASNERAYVFLM